MDPKTIETIKLLIQLNREASDRAQQSVRDHPEKYQENKRVLQTIADIIKNITNSNNILLEEILKTEAPNKEIKPDLLS